MRDIERIQHILEDNGVTYFVRSAENTNIITGQLPNKKYRQYEFNIAGGAVSTSTISVLKNGEEHKGIKAIPNHIDSLIISMYFNNQD